MSLIPPPIDYAKFFGDSELAEQTKLDKPAAFAWPLLEQINGLSQAYHAICQFRNAPLTDDMRAKITPENYAHRQTLLDLARRLIWAERNRLLEEFIELSPRASRLNIG